MQPELFTPTSSFPSRTLPPLVVLQPYGHRRVGLPEDADAAVLQNAARRRRAHELSIQFGQTVYVRKFLPEEMKFTSWARGVVVGSGESRGFLGSRATYFEAELNPCIGRSTSRTIFVYPVLGEFWDPQLPEPCVTLDEAMAATVWDRIVYARAPALSGPGKDVVFSKALIMSSPLDKEIMVQFCPGTRAAQIYGHDHPTYTGPLVIVEELVPFTEQTINMFWKNEFMDPAGSADDAKNEGPIEWKMDGSRA